MKKYKWTIILINLVILLFLFNKSVFKKEALLEEGEFVLLKLAPVDPRSLMQGDYMRLNYEITDDIKLDSIPKRGFCVVKFDSINIAKKVRFQENITPLNDDEFLINYTQSDWNINIGAESYFFQEGEGKKFENAEYGGVKIDIKDNSLLVGLYDENLNLIK
ncbi:MAG: GDYXXLXY domain-containing protein [Urechidicola sp.]|nr:GDYXXLXY domain-containing protein [Urechidicola sp.]